MHKSSAPVCWATNLCVLGPDIFIRVVFCFLTYKNIHHFTRTIKKASDNGGVERFLQNFVFSFWNLLHVTIMAPWIWTLLLDFLLICGWENINVMQLSEGKYDLEVAKMISSD
jgi:hypothetical protein